MKVMKFGGSSVATPERIQGIIKILRSYKNNGEQFAVVFSAFGGVTDMIIGMATKAKSGDKSYKTELQTFIDRHQNAAKFLLNSNLLEKVLKEQEINFTELSNILHGIYLVRDISKRTLDYMLSFGERNSAYLIAYALKENGIPADYLDARKVISTDDNFGGAKVDFTKTVAQIKAHFIENTDIQIITGFIGSTEDGVTTTLGRGGSDYTVSIFGASLDVEEIEIWTDVDGVMTADPRKVKKAFCIEEMSYAEAMEMSHFGAKVIYPPTLQPALDKSIPIRIKNTFNPEFPGTKISKNVTLGSHPIKGVSSITQIHMLTLQGSGLVGVKGTAARLFQALAQGDVNIILITQGSSEYSINFAVKPEDSNRAKVAIEKEFDLELKANYIEELKIEDNLSVIAVIGENMRYQPGIAGRLFQSLGKNGINLVAIAQGSSELNISMVISQKDEVKALNAMHEAFFLSDSQVLHVFMVGVGLIGGTLINQVKKQAGYLKDNRSLEIKIVGLANSKKMLLNEDGLNLDSWADDLATSSDPMTMESYIDKMKDLNLRNTIFIDNTANKNIAQYYESILDKSISIITPNKIATSSDYKSYIKLKSLAKKRGVGFLYETNVGAGLPVITTLNDLISSGDQILKIEGVLSGSLSFIFNNFEPGKKFSDIVKQAQELGYTEPDPREDLSGADVRRKLLILSRETGLAMEAEDIVIENILPQACIDAPTVPEFFSALEDADDHFEGLIKKAKEQNGALRFIATLDGDQAKIALNTVDNEHPFFGLSGSDNMIVFTTERYKERPLVIRGPGAGAEVTAAGVFAEIISLGNNNE